jgi:hypothetical protein
MSEVTGKLLDGSDVVAGFEQVGRRAVAKGVAPWHETCSSPMYRKGGPCASRSLNGAARG